MATVDQSMLSFSPTLLLLLLLHNPANSFSPPSPSCTFSSYSSSFLLLLPALPFISSESDPCPPCYRFNCDFKVCAAAWWDNCEDVCAGDNCEDTRTEMEKLRKKREECLLKIRSATWRAYLMKEKSKAMAKDQSSLEARLEMCVDYEMIIRVPSQKIQSASVRGVA